MIHLILDTNVWFYLANSYNPLKQDFEGELHFKLISILIDLVNNNEITILANEIIIEEWNRNKEVANKLIQKYKSAVDGNKGHIRNMKAFLDKDDCLKLDEIFENYTDKVNQIIKNNENHVFLVEDLLLNKTKKIEVTNEVKVAAANRAIGKLAPFKGNKSNSMADAVILLSAIEFIEKREFWVRYEGFRALPPKSIFITINKHDFADPEDESKVHPELRPLLATIGMDYESNIGKVINQVQNSLIEQEELDQIEREMEDAFWESHDICTVCYIDREKKIFHDNIIDFSEPIEIKNELIESIDSSQLKLFAWEADEGEINENLKKRHSVNTVRIGECRFCNAEYLKCQYCGTSNNIEELIEENKLQCEGCGMSYHIEYRYVGEEMYETEIKIMNMKIEEEE